MFARHYYYAKNYHLGMDACDDTGAKIYSVRAFRSMEARSAWVLKGAGNPSERGHRVSVQACELRPYEKAGAVSTLAAMAIAQGDDED